MGFLKDFFAGGVSEVIDSVGNTIDKFVTTDEDKQRAMLAKQEFKLKMKEFQMNAEDALIKDRQSAREMYMKDSSLQKVFAVTFLIAYCVISAGMISMIIAIAFFSKTISLPEWGIMIISSVFTAMSSKVATITDFLFGGSKSKDDSDKRTAEAFKDR